MLLINGEAQVEELKLAIVSVEHIPSRSTVLAGPPHVLPQAVERRTFLGITLRVVAIGIADVSLEWRDPVDLVGGLERHGDHGGL